MTAFKTLSTAQLRINRNFNLLDTPNSRQYLAKAEQIALAKQNEQARASAFNQNQNNRIQRSRIQAAASATAAGMRASTAATNSARLLTEFVNERAQRRALRTRQGDQAVGAINASFGASGVSSIGASMEQRRQNRLQGNIAESQANSRVEQILGSARSAITGAVATGVQASGSLAAASIRDVRAPTLTSNKNPTPLQSGIDFVGKLGSPNAFGGQPWVQGGLARSRGMTI